MMIGIDVRGLADVKKALAGLTGQESDKAMQMAINKTATKGRAEINRAVLEKYAIKANEVRNSVEVRQAYKKQRVAVAEISVFGSPSRRGRSMNLIHFLATLGGMKTRGSRASRKEIKTLGEQMGFRITKAGGMKKIEGAFIGNKGRTIFRRIGKERKPIDAMRVIGVSQMFNSRALRGRVMAKISDDFEAELGRAVAAIVGRRK